MIYIGKHYGIEWFITKKDSKKGLYLRLSPSHKWEIWKDEMMREDEKDWDVADTSKRAQSPHLLISFLFDYTEYLTF